MNIVIIIMSSFDLILVPLVAYFAVWALSSRIDTNARWHHQALKTEIDTLC